MQKSQNVSQNLKDSTSFEKLKQVIGKGRQSANSHEVVLDITYDEQPPFDRPRPLFRISNLKDYYNNELFTATTGHVLDAIKNSAPLKNFTFSEIMISCAWTRDWDNSWDLALSFFMEAKGSNKFYFFEVELNTSQKVKTSAFSPKIYKVLCFIVDDEVAYVDNLIDVADAGVKSIEDGKYANYKVVDIITAKHLFDYKLINPEHYVISFYVRDENQNQYVGVLACTIEEESSDVLPASFQIINSIIDLFKVSSDISFEILTPEKVKSSPQIIEALSFIRKHKMVGETLYGKDVSEILSGVSFKQQSPDELELILNFVNLPKVVNQIHLLCLRKEGNLIFSNKKEEKCYLNPLTSQKKKSLSVTEIQTALDKILMRDSSYKKFIGSNVEAILSCNCVIDDNLIFPEYWEVKFSANLKNKTSKAFLAITYAVHDFDNELIPVTLYELNGKGEFYKYSELRMLGDFILEIKNEKNLKERKYSYEINVPNFTNSNQRRLIDSHLLFVKKELKEKSKIEIDPQVPMQFLNSTMRFFEENHELTTYVHMGAKDLNEDIITELTITISNILESKSELKNARCFFLKNLTDSEYLPYEVLTSILWGTSFNNSYIGFEIVKMKRTAYLQNSPLNYIYSLEFNTGQSTTNQRIVFGVKRDKSFVVLVPVTYCYLKK